MSKHLYPRLRNLFANYFGQFWEEDYDWEKQEPHFEGVVKFYMKKHSEERLAQTKQELEHLIDRKLDEDELHELIYRELWSFFRPMGVEMSYQEWLEAILSILKKGDVSGSPKLKQE